ncbi:expressed unknown protein [Seminavis robusta]|uniref:Uncharacterized protein n=1 Tax=Seminavis robusta TaxID=568900 RepID=A0A9N8HIE7_9STRA|nr:expressed unknown protein [Seminavis robusta]|eukprot:Sro693_g188400.1 n/a (507) ;mRNA; r:49578-51098
MDRSVRRRLGSRDDCEKQQNHKGSASSKWQSLDCDKLEPYIRSGAIALIDSEWIIRYSKESKTKPVPHRQNLPPDALVSLDTLKANVEERGRLPIFALSYTWLHPNHPDPHSHQLETLAEGLADMMKIVVPDGESEGGMTWQRRKCFLFWDYLSLYQHPNPQRKVWRSKEENRLFRQGLDGMKYLYCHKEIRVIRIESFPPQYPQGYNLPKNANISPYCDRGWPFLETSLSSLNPEMDGTILLQKGAKRDTFAQDRDRSPILAPAYFEEALQKKTLTNQKDDKPIILQLYKECFEETCADITRLHLFDMSWSDETVSKMAKAVFAAGYTPKLDWLSLQGNFLGAKSCAEIAAAVKCGNLPSLKHLDLSRNPDIGDKGVAALAEAMGCINIQVLELVETGFHDSGCSALVDGLVKTAPSSSLCRLDISGNSFSPAGLGCLGRLVAQCSCLTDLSLRGSVGEHSKAISSFKELCKSNGVLAMMDEDDFGLEDNDVDSLWSHVQFGDYS